MVDTSAWIETMRPRGDAFIRETVSDLLRNRRAAWCDMVKLELWNGAFAKEMPALEALETDVVALETTDEIWKAARDLARQVRRKGFSVPANDLLIMACARFHGADLIHKDKHFDQIKAL